MDYNSGTNYKLIGENEKPKIRMEVEKIPLVKELISKIIEEDYQYWTKKNLKQPGIERFILLGKVSKEIKINSNVFDAALEELEMEQIIIPFNDGHFNRIIKAFFHV